MPSSIRIPTQGVINQSFWGSPLKKLPVMGRSPGERKGYPLQYSGLENSMDCIVHGVTKSRIQLSNFHFHFCQKIKTLNIWSNTFPPQGEAASLEFLLLAPCCTVGDDYGKSVCLSKPVLCDPKFVALSCQHLDSGKVKTSPSGNPLKCLQTWCIFQSSPSLYNKMQETETFLVTTLHWVGERYYGKRLPHISLLPLIWLVLHSNVV